jgi:hypothetical protein
MDHGTVSLTAEAPAPGSERPLLLDPGSAINPVEHIEFVPKVDCLVGTAQQWWARPRNNSLFGQVTIKVCDLNNVEMKSYRKLILPSFK